MKAFTRIVCLWMVLAGGLPGADAEFSAWQDDFRRALVTDRGKNLERFFRPEAYEQEMAGWKYNLQNGFLDFSGAEIIPLSDKAILLHVPTPLQPYSGGSEDSYFDFLYRIYELDRRGGALAIARRAEEDFNPDFIHVRGRIEIRPREGRCLIESTVTADLRADHFLFKLAKEFEIAELAIDGIKTSYKRLGYFVLIPWDRGKRIVLSLKGTLKAPGDNNQFFSLDRNGFFLRMGGFAALPSPPPGRDGRYVFSKDRTAFDLTYVFPKEFALIQYGRVIRESTIGESRIVAVSLEGDWMDNLAFYAQRNWEPKTVRAGQARLSFYFPREEGPAREFIVKETKKLLDWSFSVFQAYPESTVNFIVLDRFVENGALADGHSIIARDARTHADDTYIHEMLHTVPQPALKEDFLWVKEGFTNFLSFEYIDFRDGQKEFWEKQRRRFLHSFEQFSEPLSALTSTRMPTYWTAYQKGPWVYRMLSFVIGQPAFREAMREFGKMKGRVLDGPREYFGIFERISGQDLSWFENQWLNLKENPVLRIERSYETSPLGNHVRLKIEQEGKTFRLPLDVEIESQSETVRKTFWLTSAVQEFSIPLPSPPLSVRFDPGAKLFAILKTGTTSFLEPGEVLLPAVPAVYRFKSSRNGKVVEYRIVPGKNVVAFIKKEGDKESVLELSAALSPSKYGVSGDLVYTLDPAAGTINFAGAAYDIAEPVYPEDFVGWLFSCVDWTKSSAESLLFLRSGQKRCAGAYAKREKIAGRDVTLKIDTYAGTLEMSIRNGVPVEYTVDGGEKFVLMER